MLAPKSIEEYALRRASKSAIPDDAELIIEKGDGIITGTFSWKNEAGTGWETVVTVNWPTPGQVLIKPLEVPSDDTSQVDISPSINSGAFRIFYHQKVECWTSLHLDVTVTEFSPDMGYIDMFDEHALVLRNREAGQWELCLAGAEGTDGTLTIERLARVFSTKPQNPPTPQRQRPIFYKVKYHCHVKWPCAGDPERTLELFPLDILRRQSNGKYVKINGLCCINIIIDDDLIEEAK